MKFPNLSKQILILSLLQYGVFLHSLNCGKESVIVSRTNTAVSRTRERDTHVEFTSTQIA